MNLKLEKVTSDDLLKYKQDMQEAFQKGFEDVYGKTEGIILPEKDIDEALNINGAVAYKASLNGEIVGGAIVKINDDTHHNHLDFLYVKNGIQSKGIGQFIWKEIERIYANTKVWETCTPYFEKRNIHFYVNKCGFHIVEFYNPMNKDPNSSDEMIDGDYFFRFEKVF